MTLPRLSLATIGFAISVLAIDLAVIREAFRGPDLEGWTFFALLLLPMLDALLIALYRLRRRGRRTAGAVGFFGAGSVATLVVFVAGLGAPETALGLLRSVGRPIALASINGLTRLLGNAAMQHWGMQLTVGVAFEVLFPIAFFCALPLLVALLGGWLGRCLRPVPSIASAGLG